MREFKSYKEKQKEAVEDSQMRIMGDDHKKYGIIESPLVFDGDIKRITYDSDFRNVLPKGENVKDYIESALVDKKGNAVLLELGGTGSRLAGGFTPGVFKKSLGINLIDVRDRVDPTLREADKKRNHSVLEGDLMSDETYEKTQEWLGEGGKVDVIIERMVGGLENLPFEPFIIANRANQWYEMLSDNGMIFAEVPYAVRGYMANWTKLITEKYDDVLHVKRSNSYVHVRKLPGAPASLPLLSAKDVMKKELEKRRY